MSTRLLLFLLLPIATTTNALTSAPAAGADRLLELLASKRRGILVPGVHDARSATILSQVQPQYLFLSGFGVSAATLGVPDAGILTYREMEDVVRNVVGAATASIPIIVDGDTGYGGCSNI